MSVTAPLIELLAQLEEPFTGETLFDCLTDLVFFIKNARGEYVAVNQEMVARCGCRQKAELIGRRADEIYPSPLGESYRAQDETLLRTGEPILKQLELQLDHRRRTGWCLTDKLPLRGRQGAIVGLVGISKDLHTPDEKSEDFSSVAKAVRLVQTRFEEPLKVRELARLAGLSSYQFDRRIRKIFHITTGQFLHKVRMDAAVRRLRETDKSIAWIAQSCGYSDQSAFTRQFHQTVGMSPTQFRRATQAPLL